MSAGLPFCELEEDQGVLRDVLAFIDAVEGENGPSGVSSSPKVGNTPPPAISETAAKSARRKAIPPTTSGTDERRRKQ
ncbi:unnamed protein product [Phytophthora lilii]|uniref:Unnamed protein product n=1 Tax=Phytophthora lilii TaxID=2077276 RepID=A0A9W6TAU0_9STRA|nr:unnamed protein product [Phytophthora lilii]